MQIKNHALLGGFIAVGAGLFVLAVLTVGSRQQLFSRTQLARVVFDDASGLQAGNNVWLSGVKVGTVKKIGLTSDNRVEVTLSIGRHEFAHLYTDTRGKIGSDGLIGNRIVVLYGGTPDAGRLPDGGTLAGTKTVNTDDMLATLQENNKNLLSITGQFKVIAGKINEGKGTIGLLLNDPATAGRLRRTVAGLQTAAQTTDKLTARLDSFAGQLNNRTGLAYEVANDTTVFQQVRDMVTQLRTASATIALTAANIRQASDGLGQRNTPAGVLLKDETVASDLKITSAHLRTSSEKLDEDLEALQHNFLLRGFFRKKAKAAQKAPPRQKDSARIAGQ
ncbi:MAG TPA: MlaD family protein [Puia sp.]|nr:MlaD family protein [Puia sp.]